MLKGNSPLLQHHYHSSIKDKKDHEKENFVGKRNEERRKLKKKI